MAHPGKSTDPNVFILPDLGEGVHEAELIKWRVKVGDTVAEHDILAEMETDKALVEVPSPRPGTIEALHGNEGEILHVGNPLVTYKGGAAASSHDARSSRESSRSATPENGQSAHAQASRVSPEARDTSHSEKPSEPSADREDAGTVVGKMGGELGGVSAAPGKALATPAVRRLARDLGVEIDSVRGSGIGGRVLEKDVRSAASAAGASSTLQAQRPSGGPGLRAAQRPEAIAAPVPRSAQSAAAPSVTRPVSPVSESRATADDTTRIPFRGVRRTIANRLRESVNQAVHFTVMDEADVTALDGLRRKLAAASGEKVSFLPFVASAVCRVLGDSRFNSLNATVDERPGDSTSEAAILQHRSIHLGIATDTDTGLMVPVIRDCDRLGVLEIGRSITLIAEMARNRSIPREQLIGGTFTISNVGSHAGRFATPIINYPEVGILAVGRGREGMVVNKGSFRVGFLLPLSLACDHRVVDGATAALALAEVVRLLQEPESLLTPAKG